MKLDLQSAGSSPNLTYTKLSAQVKKYLNFSMWLFSCEDASPNVCVLVCMSVVNVSECLAVLV